MILAICSTKNIGMLKLYLSFDNLKLLISSFSFHYLYINTGIIMRLPNQKLAISNLALIAYYVLPNFTTFALVLLFIGLTLSSQIFTNILQIQQKGQNTVNDTFNWYLSASYSKKILVIIAVGLISQLAYLLPNWLVLLLIAELWASWDTLVEIGMIELVETQVASAEVSMKKLFNMIPRYQGQ